MATAVFAVTVVTVLGVYLSAARAVGRQREYLWFESVCLDIDFYYDKFGAEEWAEQYFGNSEAEQYYTADFRRSDAPDKYTLSYRFADGCLFVSVRDEENGRYVIENLNYGKSKNG